MLRFDAGTSTDGGDLSPTRLAQGQAGTRIYKHSSNQTEIAFDPKQQFDITPKHYIRTPILEETESGLAADEIHRGVGGGGGHISRR